VEQGRHLIASEPLYGFGYYALGFALIWAGQADEAIACLQRSIELDGRASHCVALLGTAYAVAGQKGKAFECLAELDALERSGRNVATWQLHIYAGIANADRVIQCLEVGIAQRISSTVFMVTNPFLDFVRQDPRFVALLQKMGLGYLTTRTWQPEWRPPTRTSPTA
jgi:tetratricopeptide (TPR) repeat protein